MLYKLISENSKYYPVLVIAYIISLKLFDLSSYFEIVFSSLLLILGLVVLGIKLNEKNISKTNLGLLALSITILIGMLFIYWLN